MLKLDRCSRRLLVAFRNVASVNRIWNILNADMNTFRCGVEARRRFTRVIAAFEKRWIRDNERVVGRDREATVVEFCLIEWLIFKFPLVVDVQRAIVLCVAQKAKRAARLKTRKKCAAALSPRFAPGRFAVAR